jgi:hypothetical protein
VAMSRVTWERCFLSTRSLAYYASQLVPVSTWFPTSLPSVLHTVFTEQPVMLTIWLAVLALTTLAAVADALSSAAAANNVDRAAEKRQFRLCSATCILTIVQSMRSCFPRRPPSRHPIACKKPVVPCRCGVGVVSVTRRVTC